MSVLEPPAGYPERSGPIDVYQALVTAAAPFSVALLDSPITTHEKSVALAHLSMAILWADPGVVVPAKRGTLL